MPQSFDKEAVAPLLRAPAEQGGSAVSPRMDNAAACTPTMEQGGRVDEAMVERAVRAAYWYDTTERLHIDNDTMEVALQAALAQNAQGEAVAEVTDGAGKFAYLGGSPALPAGTKLYLHAERARVPDSIPLDDDVREILGRMCFQCIRVASRLRQLGHVIEKRAEAEQAAVLHWMLNHYLKHGKEWCKFADAELNAAAPSQPEDAA